MLQLVAQGRSNVEIERRLFLAEKTVRNNLTTLLPKTGAATRPELIALPETPVSLGDDTPFEPGLKPQPE